MNNIIPIIIYSDIENDKISIYKNNKNKCGIYRWTNKINNKSYIGSSVNLSKRFTTYFSLKALKRVVEKESSAIYSAIIKYGYNNFKLEILEYCDKSTVIQREQHYMEKLNPEYNILKIAKSRYGHNLKFKVKKALSISLNKYYSKKISKQILINKNTDCNIIDNSTKEKKYVKYQGITVKLFDSSGNFINKFSSLKDTANYLNISIQTLRNIYKRGISYDNYIYEFELKDIRIWVYDINHTLIDVLKNAITVSIKYNIPPSTLSPYINSDKSYKNKYYFYNKDYIIKKL